MAEQRSERPRRRKPQESLRARFEKWAPEWWRERGGPAGVRDAFLSNIDTIGAAFEPGKAQEAFGKVRKLLVWKAHAAGYAAMIGDITAAALAARFFWRLGARSSETSRRVLVNAFEEALRERRARRGGEPPQQQTAQKATVIDNATGKIIEDDPGYRHTTEDTIEDALRRRGQANAQFTSNVIRTAHGLAGAYAAGAILERGPVHAVAKFDAKLERGSGIMVARIVNRIVRGWNNNPPASNLHDNQMFEASAKP